MDHKDDPEWGLSPCVRGNLIQGFMQVDVHRSIPVRTGEPQIVCTPVSMWKVYPRAYGGTSSAPPVGLVKIGLSPCVRGTSSAPPVGLVKIGLSPCVRGNPDYGPQRRP